MTAFEDAARRVLNDTYIRLGQAYGVAGDEEPIITFAEFSWPGTVSGCEIRGGHRTRDEDRVSAAFDAICQGEIEIRAPLSPFFALEPYLAP